MTVVDKLDPNTPLRCPYCGELAEGDSGFNIEEHEDWLRSFQECEFFMECLKCGNTFWVIFNATSIKYDLSDDVRKE